MLANNAFGIDLGTRTIKIYNAHSDNVIVEKNMIAIEDKKNCSHMVTLHLKCLRRHHLVLKYLIRSAMVLLRILKICS